MHDDSLVSYTANFDDKTLEINTYNNYVKCKRKIEFENVLTHFFTGALDTNQILDIDEWSIEHFISENKDYLSSMKKYCWPTQYNELQELHDYLVKNEYKYFRIISSYGMFGWVLAKNMHY